MTHLNLTASVCSANPPGNRSPRGCRQRTSLAMIGLLCALAACDGSDIGGLRELNTGAEPGSQFPSLAITPDGFVVLSWIADNESGHALMFATSMSDGTWSEPRTVSSGDHWLVNWADFPSVVPITRDFWVAQWLVRVAEGHAYHAFVSTSINAGESWSRKTKLHTDTSATEHGFVSLFPLQNAAGAIWLDGREGSRGMSLRGATITRTGQVTNEHLIDPLVCDCCQTDAAAAGDEVIIAYRNRSADEVRDIHVSRLTTSGWQPGSPVAEDNWMVTGCPVNGPAIDSHANTLAAAWYTAADGNPRIRFARQVGNAGFSPAQDLAGGSLLGRVDVAQLPNGDSIVSWLAETPRGSAMLRLVRIDAAGQPAPALDLLETATSRPAGFPRMLLAGDHLYFAWTDVSLAPYIVRSGRISVDQVPRINAVESPADAGEPTADQL